MPWRRPHLPQGSLSAVVKSGPVPVPVALFLVLYLSFSLALGGVLHDRLWTRGHHITPEHWSFHRQLERLGIIDHHNSADGTLLARQSQLADGIAVDASGTLGSPAVQVVGASPSHGASPDGMLCQLCQRSAAPFPPTGSQRLAALIGSTTTGLRPEPPERPPRFAH